MNTMLPVVADCWLNLRGCDVYRLLNQFNYERLTSLKQAALLIIKKRPELKQHVDDARVELQQEYTGEWE